MKVEAIEERYGVEHGGDWLEVFWKSPFKMGQYLTYTNPVTDARGRVKVIGIQRKSYGIHAGKYFLRCKIYMITRPDKVRWINPKWLTPESR